MKFQVTDDAGKVVTDTSLVESVRTTTVSCGTFTGELAPAADEPATGSGLRFEDDQFVYTWETPARAGCYQLFVTLSRRWLVRRQLPVEVTPATACAASGLASGTAVLRPERRCGAGAAR